MSMLQSVKKNVTDHRRQCVNQSKEIQTVNNIDSLDFLNYFSNQSD